MTRKLGTLGGFYSGVFHVKQASPALINTKNAGAGIRLNQP